MRRCIESVVLICPYQVIGSHTFLFKWRVWLLFLPKLRTAHQPISLFPPPPPPHSLPPPPLSRSLWDRISSFSSTRLILHIFKVSFLFFAFHYYYFLSYVCIYIQVHISLCIFCGFFFNYYKSLLPQMSTFLQRSACRFIIKISIFGLTKKKIVVVCLFILK